MLKILYTILSLLFFVIASSSSAQDTLVLIDRAPLIVSSVSYDSFEVHYTVQGKSKSKSMEIQKVYSIKRPNQAEEFIYVQDTLEGIGIRKCKWPIIFKVRRMLETLIKPKPLELVQEV